MPTTYYSTWLHTFTELTPVQCLAERLGLQSGLLIPSRLTEPYLFRGESIASRSTLERKILWPLFILYFSLCLHGSGAVMEKIKHGYFFRALAYHKIIHISHSADFLFRLHKLRERIIFFNLLYLTPS